MSQDGEVTELLKEWGEGSAEALEQLMALVYAELRQLAERQLRRERPGHTLQPTALVNEAYLKLSKQNRTPWRNRDQFYGVAARLMRRILTDYFRHQHRHKHPPPELRMPLGDEVPGSVPPIPDFLALDQALRKLEAKDARQARVVELRFYAGLSVEEAADVLEVSPVTVRRDWSVAKAWLSRELGER
ncbi:MAG TPA: ECF-type sigma factor [Thermoanaerobaculia bacterium]|nr:ECF-type sigma factor [Thermoanaerobaculia bacterium]